LLTPDFVKLSHNGASDAQASVYLWVGVAIGIYVRAQVCKPGLSARHKPAIRFWAVKTVFKGWQHIRR